ncbi:MAG: 50S ribosomal protein L23 [Patescibacteria group bacterium]
MKHSKEDTKEAYRYLLRPIMTEKVSNLGALGKYVFEVAPQANKVEISKAIVALYGVKPVKVNIIRLLGKSVRYGRTTGKTKDWKKAVITLKAGETIQVYEGV